MRGQQLVLFPSVLAKILTVSHTVLSNPRKNFIVCMRALPDVGNTGWILDSEGLVNASVKGTTAEVCTRIRPDCDYATWRSRGTVLMSSLNWWKSSGIQQGQM